MFDWFRELSRRACKIPPPPEAPAGSPESVKIFRAAPNFYRQRIMFWCLGQIGFVFVIGVTLGPSILKWSGSGWPELKLPGDEFWGWFVELGIGAAVLSYVAQLPFSFALVRLDYELRWYIVTDRCLRIRHGVWRVEEKTMSFANIQEVNVQQGPVQRMLGIYNLMVRSAGGGAMPTRQSGPGENPFEDLHMGVFQGIDNAEEVRDLVLNRLKAFRDSGLGDPDDLQASQASADEPQCSSLDAAREMLAEARLLTKSIRQRKGLFVGSP